MTDPSLVGDQTTHAAAISAVTGLGTTGLLGWFLKLFISKKLAQVDEHDKRLGVLEGIGQSLTQKIDQGFNNNENMFRATNTRIEDLIKSIPKRRDD